MSAHGGMSRRRFQGCLAGASLAAAWGQIDAASAAEGSSKMSRIATRPIPSTGEAMPIVGFGTWQTFDIGTSEAERAPRREVLKLLFEAGGRMIDSSPMYGRAEAAVGDLLTGMKAHDKAFLATKVWTSGEKAGIAQMEASFAKLQTKTIDLMQVHNLLDWQTHLKTMRAWKELGRFRYLGITHYTTSSLETLAGILEREKLDFVQMGYSIGVRDAETRLLPVCRDHGVAVIVNQPFESGSLFAKVKGKPLPAFAAEFDCTSWSQFFLKFILGHPAITCVIPGTAHPDHAADNIKAGIGRLPSEAEREKMVKAWEGI